MGTSVLPYARYIDNDTYSIHTASPLADVGRAMFISFNVFTLLRRFCCLWLLVCTSPLWYGPVHTEEHFVEFRVAPFFAILHPHEVASPLWCAAGVHSITTLPAVFRRPSRMCRLCPAPLLSLHIWSRCKPPRSSSEHCHRAFTRFIEAAQNTLDCIALPRWFVEPGLVAGEQVGGGCLPIL